MADKAPELETREDRIAQAKELYARGYRNYVVGDFNDAAEDLSRSCELYADLYGDESEEVAIPNLFYGKTLIELAQMGENKVLALPDEQEEEDDEEAVAAAIAASVANADNDSDGDDDDDDEDGEIAPRLVGIDTTENKDGAGSSSAAGSSSSVAQPGPSTSTGTTNGNGNSANGAGEAEDEEANENLQFAWEALEMAAKIFRRLGASHEEYLAEAHCGLGEILMENQNCAEALKDYAIAFDIYSKLEKVKERLLAEIKYKTGLCHYSAMSYDQSIADFQQSADYMKQAIEAQKELPQTAQVEQTIDDLTKMREDILNKIADVQESKQLLMANLAAQGGRFGSLISGGGSSSADGAGTSGSSSSAAPKEKPKATDISHLIKRKKPDTIVEEPTASTDVASPAKKPAL